MPAAGVSDYDPRIVVDTVQQFNEETLKDLLKSDTMLPYKPDLIIANCPGCTFFPDRWQYVIA
jgi:heterodisulfide reductase subunit B